MKQALVFGDMPIGIDNFEVHRFLPTFCPHRAPLSHFYRVTPCRLEREIFLNLSLRSADSQSNRLAHRSSREAARGLKRPQPSS
jgi:hypothetical protein